MYLLFAGINYYPLGGFEDFIGIVEDVETGKKLIEENKEEYQWADIVNAETLNIIQSGVCDDIWGKPRFWVWEN